MASRKLEQHTAVLDELEHDLEELRRRFELYFQGLDRVPPKMDRDRLKARLNRAQGEASRWNTLERFKVNSLRQKFLSYDRMWQRESQAIEDGTSRRDRFRVKRKREREAAESGQEPVDPKHAAAAAAAAAAAKATGDDERYRRLYQVYMAAKKRTGERSSLSYDGLVTQLKKQVPVLQKKHNAKDIEFKVVLKNGKAMLKAVPKR